jgi:hypothetical protein
VGHPRCLLPADRITPQESGSSGLPLPDERALWRQAVRPGARLRVRLDRALGTLIGRARDRLAVEDHNAERDERAAEKARIAANRRPLTFVKPPDYDAISDEEAERQADELLGRSAS